MITINGKHNEAVVYTDALEDSAREQIQTLCDQPFVAGSTLRIMPDVHAGAGCTIGTTMTIADKIVPNLVGVDIGCGMEVIRIAERQLDLEALDRAIHRGIPAGRNIRSASDIHPYAEQIDLDALHCAEQVNIRRAYRSIGTLGGGNHFIEANRDDEGNLYLVVHSGSRHLGKQVAEYYQSEAIAGLNGYSKQDIEALIAQYKAEGREKEIETAIKELKKSRTSDIPPALAYVEGDQFASYLHDMRLTQHFATLNRKAMMDVLIREMALDVCEQFTTIHNYIDLDSMILRKGAVSARKGEKFILPMNMRDGSLLCIGKGNPDWNESAPHGAGRTMSRMTARKKLNLADFRQSMEGIYSTTIGRNTLDEAPMAYKPAEEIIRQIGGTADILTTITPIYNFKAME